MLQIKFMGTCEIVLKSVPQNTFDDKSTLVKEGRVLWHLIGQFQYIFSVQWNIYKVIHIQGDFEHLSLCLTGEHYACWWATLLGQNLCKNFLYGYRE